ncbi:hypothetical protein BC829DRAFT_409325 [Chytridium lagenaria]|nr:hypothetical protein BC829DRAFT_409325 [Chytridium lagenaria]
MVAERERSYDVLVTTMASDVMLAPASIGMLRTDMEVPLIFGIATQVTPARKATRGADWILSCCIKDPSSSFELRLNLFKPSREDFPPDIPLHRIICITHIRTQTFQDKLVAVSTKQSQVILCPEYIDKGSELWPYKPIITQLLDWRQSELKNAGVVRTMNVSTSLAITQNVSKRRVATVAELKPNMFCDMYCQVISIPNPERTQRFASIIISDFTSNPMITWDLRLGDYVFLRNVRVKNTRGFFEAALHGNSNPKNNGTLITTVDSLLPEVLNLRTRSLKLDMDLGHPHSFPPASIRQLQTNCSGAFEYLTCRSCAACVVQARSDSEFCKCGAPFQYEYFFSLLLTDGTGLVHNEEMKERVISKPGLERYFACHVKALRRVRGDRYKIFGTQ